MRRIAFFFWIRRNSLLEINQRLRRTVLRMPLFTTFLRKRLSNCSCDSLGCSFTYGAGVNVEDRWSDVFCKKVQETTNLKVRNYNLALEGHSNDYCARMVFKTIENLKPDLYCFLFTYRNRMEWVSSEAHKVTNVIPGHDDVFINIMNDGIAMYNFHKNYTLINALCNLHKVPFLFSTVDPRIHNSVEHMPHYVGKFDRDIKGIDGEHPSAEKQHELGERFFNKYKELL